MIKKILTYVLTFISGILVTAIILEQDFIFNYIKIFNWQTIITNIITITYFFAGIALTLLINKSSIDKAERSKIQAELVREKLNYVSNFKLYIGLLKTSTAYDKKYKDMNYKVNYINEQQINKKVYGKSLLSSIETYNDLYAKFIEVFYVLGTIPYRDISDWLWYARNYFNMLDTVVKKFNDNNIWELSVVVYADISTMADDIDTIMMNYTNEKVKKLSVLENYKKSLYTEDSMKEKLEKTDLYKTFFKYSE